MFWHTSGKGDVYKKQHFKHIRPDGYFLAQMEVLLSAWRPTSTLWEEKQWTTGRLKNAAYFRKCLMGGCEWGLSSTVGRTACLQIVLAARPWGLWTVGKTVLKDWKHPGRLYWQCNQVSLAKVKPVDHFCSLLLEFVQNPEDGDWRLIVDQLSTWNGVHPTFPLVDSYNRKRRRWSSCWGERWKEVIKQLSHFVWIGPGKRTTPLGPTKSSWCRLLGRDTSCLSDHFIIKATVEASRITCLPGNWRGSWSLCCLLKHVSAKLFSEKILAPGKSS